jgi:hypothetical protein
MNHQNEAAPFVIDYLRRKSFKQLGYVHDVETLDVFTAECYVIIGNEFAKIDRKKREREASSGKNNRRT